eukprot:COSAG04_NODE_600_length_12210_cov_30.165635_11_plen_290_part_01
MVGSMLRALMLALAVAHSAACSRHSSCSGDRYCDSSRNCYDCDYVRNNGCDAYNGDCSVCGVSSRSSSRRRSSSYSSYSSSSSSSSSSPSSSSSRSRSIDDILPEQQCNIRLWVPDDAGDLIQLASNALFGAQHEAVTCDGRPTLEGPCMSVMAGLDRGLLGLIAEGKSPEEHCEDICTLGWPGGLVLWFESPCNQLEAPLVGPVAAVQLTYPIPWGLVLIGLIVAAILWCCCCCSRSEPNARAQPQQWTHVIDIESALPKQVHLPAVSAVPVARPAVQRARQLSQSLSR